ncbi:MAG: Gfo/Idh/MocA family oxidoreductase [Actinomycetota bacterium]|nr:Gfo/Idh/MocA family oxidoreductase [Actinomycetota bacterium]
MSDSTRGPATHDPAPLRVAVVGLGVGRLHVLAFKELRHRFHVTIVCDHDQARADEVAGWLRGVRATTELAEVLASDEVDVVSLCTPPAQHRDQIEAVLRAGKDVICEKPLVGSVNEVDEIATIASESGHTVMPIFQYRFGRGIQKLRRLVDADITGRPYVANVDVSWRRGADYYAAPWRGTWSGELGGVLTSHAQHALDLTMFVLGPPIAVWARTSTLVNTVETEDCAAVTLRWADGSLATVSATLGSVEEISRHRFTFERLSAESGTAPYANSADPWTMTPVDADTASRIDGVLAGTPEQREDYAGQFERYADARAAGSEPPVTLTDARRAIELLTALYVSAREDREVELPLARDSAALRGWRP